MKSKNIKLSSWMVGAVGIVLLSAVVIGFMVAKQDHAEFLGAWCFQSKTTLGLSVLFGLVMLVVGIAYWQRSKEAYYKSLYECDAKLRMSLEKHRITLKAVGDAVIATDQQGCVDYLNPVAERLTGTTFNIFLPSQETPIQELPTEVEPTIPEGHGETILIVEDEPTLLKLSATMLTRLGYRVLSAPTPEAALKLAEMQTGGLDLLLSDVVMPGMNGKELAVKILALYPSTKVLFMSGYTADVIANHGILDQGVHFIQKPFTRNDIAAQVDKCLRGA